MTDRPIAIIGAGVVGTAVASILEKRGYNVVAVAARTKTSLDRANAYLNAATTTDTVAAAKAGKVILITTADDAIKQTCDSVAAAGGFDSGDTVFHMSGALQLSVLEGARHFGARIGSIHPMQTFADVSGAIDALPGSVFGVTAEGETLSMAKDLVAALGGESFLISDEDKPLYHAAACAVSNYLVSLVDYGEALYRVIGIPEASARQAFLPLLKGTVENIARSGPKAALTGPIARGDTGTVRKHIEAIEKNAHWAGSLYREMGAYTVKVAMEKGTLDEATALELIKVLRGSA